MALIGVLTGTTGEINPWPLVAKSLHMVGIYVDDRSMFDDLVTAMAVSDIHPVIDRVFPFDDAPAAYRHLESQTQARWSSASEMYHDR